MRTNDLLALLDRPDQERVIADLRTFVGANADRFLAVYDKMRARRRVQPIGWCWPAFFVAMPWLFYRKMWIWGAAVLLVPIVINFVLPGVANYGGFGVGVVLTLYGKAYYVQNALKRIGKADELGLVAEARDDYLRRAGGASVVGAIVGALILVALITIVALAQQQHQFR